MCKVERTCDICGHIFEYADLLKDKRKKDGVRPRCNSCENERKKNSEYYTNHKKELRDIYKKSEEYRSLMKTRRKNYVMSNLELVLLSQARYRAEKFNLDFNLDVSDIVIPNICPILEIPLVRGNKIKSQNSPSVDRINNSLGYIKGNVRVISYLANHMKANATKEQLLLFAKNIEKYISNDDIVRPIENENL